MSAIDITKLKVVTSSEKKISEIRGFGFPDINVETGLDLREIDGRADDVIVYKAIDAGDGHIVEDTILVIDGEEIVDTKYRLAELDDWAGLNARWEVRLGVNCGGQITVFKSERHGIITTPKGEGTDFDPYFWIIEEGLTLAELKLMGRKDEYSPRKAAFEKLRNGDAYAVHKIEDVPNWQGGYQI